MTKFRGYIDIASVKATTSLEQVLTHYGILENLKPSGGSLRGCCPIHKGTDPSQFSATLDKNLWRCFSECQHGGNHLDLVMRLEGCSANEAAWLMNDWFGLGLAKMAGHTPPSKGGRADQRPPRSPKGNPPQGLIKSATAEPVAAEECPQEEGQNQPSEAFLIPNLDGSHPYLTERGLTPETVAHFGIGYCAKGIMAGRIAIPIHNADGQIVANAGRWPGEPPEGKEKYRLPGKFKKTLELYNLHRAALESADAPLVIVEGFFPVMHLWQLGVRRVVALMGSFMSARQEELLARLITPDSRTVLMLDNDAAGHAAQMKILPRLAEHCFVHAFRWEDGIEQPDALSAEHLTTLR